MDQEREHPHGEPPAGDAPGRPESPGKSEQAPGQTKPETKPAEPADATPDAEPKVVEPADAADAGIASKSEALDEGAPSSSGAIADDDGQEGA